MAREELDPLERLEVRAARVHELDRPVDLARERLVAGMGRVLREALVPRVHEPQVGEAALSEGPDEVQRRRGGVVGTEHACGVVRAGLRRECVAVDDVAAVGGQRHAVAGLRVRRARLGELARHAAHLDDRELGAIRQHDGHLEDRLHARADAVRGRGLEGLGAVAPLQEERLPLGGGGEAIPEDVHLAGKDERRKARELRDGGTEDVLIRP